MGELEANSKSLWMDAAHLASTRQIGKMVPDQQMPQDHLVCDLISLAVCTTIYKYTVK